MKFINELSEGERVESVFAVGEKNVRTTRAGKPFIQLKLSDRTGRVDAVAWENAEALARKFEKGDLIGIRGEVGSYNGTKQLTVLTIKKLEHTPEYVARVLPTSDRGVDDMVAELKELAAGIKDDAVRELVEGLLGDEAFMAGFVRAPAAKGLHHVFSGGLLQHTLKVARLCALVCDEYAKADPLISSMIDRDLLVAGAIFHDIGKVWELSAGPDFDYTFRGRMLGHLPLGLMEMEKRIARVPGISSERADLLMHMLLSHHGEYEYGSPKRPKCMEAFILHYADNLDAKLQGLAEYVDKDGAEGKFTAYHKIYERYFYKGGAGKDGDKEAGTADEHPERPDPG